jgi:geranylgeranyl pyrophosphate synthase
MSGSINLETARSLLWKHLWKYLEDLPSVLREDIVEVLSGEGKLLHQPVSALDGRWALLPFYLTCDLSSDVDVASACTVALTMECIACATDLFDDVMDDDLTPAIQHLGLARALNAAFALVYLVQHMLLSLVHPANPLPLLDIVQRAMLAASAGQQRDVLAEKRRACELSRKECLEIASAKAGTLLGLACDLGAVCAGVDPARRERCAELGRLLGIAAQLDNDANDLSQQLLPLAGLQSNRSRKSDLARAKKTLPIVLAAHSLRATHTLDAQQIDSAFQRLSDLSGEEREYCMRALREGIVATWGIALLYRERARDCLSVIERGGSSLSPDLRRVLGLAEVLEE